MEIWNSIFTRIVAGGIYMIPIIFLSILMFSFVLFRGITVWLVHRELNALFLHGLENMNPSGKWNIRAHEYRQFRSGIETIDFALRETLSQELVGRVGTGNGILLCAALATLLGLLGTVSGMITSFEAIYDYGVGNTKSMSAGISQALITTQSGLLVSIVGVMLGKLLSRMTFRLEQKVLHFYTLIEQNT